MHLMLHLLRLRSQAKKNRLKKRAFIAASHPGPVINPFSNLQISTSSNYSRHYFITLTQSLKYFVYFSYIIIADEKSLLLLITATAAGISVLFAKGALCAYQ